MKKFIFLLFFIIPFQLVAQSDLGFAPVGAKWHYTTYYSGAIDHTVYKSTKDTLINGSLCSVITITGNTALQNAASLPNYYISHYDSNRVYWLNFSSGELELLYDFNADIGDTWQVVAQCLRTQSPYLDTITFTVDSVYYDSINGQSLKFLELTFPDRSGGNGYLLIAEYLGGVSRPFPDDLICGGMIHFWFGGLRCYEDSIIGSNVWHSPCDIFVGLSEEELKQNLLINPVPADLHLDIRTNESIYQVILRNLSGQKVKMLSVNNNSCRLNTENVPNGFYLLEIVTKKGIIQSRKVIIQH
jgi:hypothetical protein